MGMEIQAPDGEIERALIVDRFGNYMITIDKNNCLWYGPYSTGKLAIYKADIVGETTEPIFCLFFVYADETQPHLQSIGYQCYEVAFKPGEAITELLDTLSDEFVKLNQEEKDKAMQDGHQLQ